MIKSNSECEKGLVSIIIPTHNRADLICETLESIKRQSYKMIEVLVVDDHSEDNTKEIVKKFIQQHSELKVFLFDNDGKGACAARNKGIRESKGEYLQFFDDDDLMLENHIERKVKEIEESDSDYVTCNYYFFDNTTKECIGHKNISSVDLNCSAFLLTKSFPCPCFMWSRKSINAMGEWNENIKKLQDMVYYQRLFIKGLKGTRLPEELFEVRVHNNSMTSRNVATPQGYYNCYDAYSAIEEEWQNVFLREKESVLKSLLFLKYTLARNMCKKGFIKQGAKLMFSILSHNFMNSISFLWIIAKYRTIHITNALVKENSIKTLI